MLKGRMSPEKNKLKKTIPKELHSISKEIIIADAKPDKPFSALTISAVAFPKIKPQPI